MSVTIGNGTITGLSAGGLNDGCIIGATFAGDTLSLADFASSVWASSKASAGYQYFPGGIIFQWGRFNNRASTAAITFPIAFSAVCYSVIVTQQAASDTGGTGNGPALASIPSTTGVTLSIQNMTTDPSTGHYIAIGY